MKTGMVRNALTILTRRVVTKGGDCFEKGCIPLDERSRQCLMVVIHQPRTNSPEVTGFRLVRTRTVMERLVDLLVEQSRC